MLGQLSIYTVLPVHDLERARKFYRDILGLEPTMEKPGMLSYSGPSGYLFQLYETPSAGTATSTQMGLSSSQLDQDMAELRSRGVAFEEYDFPGLKTEDGVALVGTERAAWFKDSEGNTICLSQTVTAPHLVGQS
ncbi:VOC family protein [Subtercola frigoramans]|uniref:Catechol 2,3-dioxygenase-like lactoylglutathione lyase family enzyme n=1 Tax=Subtercola frigoramans TaxID=120298 RepID=A0ABS2L3P4_9MICO|nr:VOC family protein [Subtercola frigoramans]MBM7471639.1 catechol 2,3-dioxygenase-like lactoylglutathione lyase family enzyme [Subtercola frigoramans]